MMTYDEFLERKSPSVFIMVGDALERLRELPSESVHCCVTSPPYFGLRDYGVKGQIGMEKTPAEYVAKLVAVFEEVRRVLRKDGTLWLNLGDSYAANSKGSGGATAKQVTNGGSFYKSRKSEHGVKSKDLIGAPWLIAFALRTAGWYLRSDIIWAKANCMPESVTDRPTRSHEFIFLLSKSARYHYDADAIKEPCIYDVDGSQTLARKARASEDQKSHATTERNGWRAGGFKDAEKANGKHSKQRGHSRRHNGFNERWDQCTGMRNKRDVWTVAPANYPEAHFATFPPELIKPCVLAGCPIGGIALDPFAGSGTTGEVALELGRKAVLIELNPEYVPLIEKRTNITPGLPLTTLPCLICADATGDSR